MTDDGAVARATVIRVLAAHGVDLVDSSDGALTSGKGDDPKGTLKVHILSDPVRRRMLHYLARTFSIPIHHFYNEEMAVQRQPSSS